MGLIIAALEKDGIWKIGEFQEKVCIPIELNSESLGTECWIQSQRESERLICIQFGAKTGRQGRFYKWHIWLGLEKKRVAWTWPLRKKCPGQRVYSCNVGTVAPCTHIPQRWAHLIPCQQMWAEKEEPLQLEACRHTCYPSASPGERVAAAGASALKAPSSTRAPKKMLSMLEEAGGMSRFTQQNKQKDLHPSMQARTRANSKHTKLVFNVVWEGSGERGKQHFQTTVSGSLSAPLVSACLRQFSKPPDRKAATPGTRLSACIAEQKEQAGGLGQTPAPDLFTFFRSSRYLAAQSFLTYQDFALQEFPGDKWNPITGNRKTSQSGR